MILAMEFRRAEIKKVYRHKEDIQSSEEIIAVFEAVTMNNLTFSAKISNIASELHECAIVHIGKESVRLLSRSPLKLKVEAKYKDIQWIEIVCNREIVAEEDDDGGRWARIIN